MGFCCNSTAPPRACKCAEGCRNSVLTHSYASQQLVHMGQGGAAWSALRGSLEHFMYKRVHFDLGSISQHHHRGSVVQGPGGTVAEHSPLLHAHQKGSPAGTMNDAATRLWYSSTAPCGLCIHVV